jgi:hypothetical protein
MMFMGTYEVTLPYIRLLGQCLKVRLEISSILAYEKRALHSQRRLSRFLSGRSTTSSLTPLLWQPL